MILIREIHCMISIFFDQVVGIRWRLTLALKKFLTALATSSTSPETCPRFQSSDDDKASRSHFFPNCSKKLDRFNSDSNILPIDKQMSVLIVVTL